MNDSAALAGVDAAAGHEARRALRELFHGLHAALQALFTERPLALRRQRTLLQRRLLLGLELVSKLEEQALYPALAEAEPGWAGVIQQAAQELELLRDVALLATRTAAGNRDVALSVLEGLATLHFARVDELLRRPGADNVPWPHLEREVRSLLGRWQAEVQRAGEIEDEDRDPVGLPPRL